MSKSVKIASYVNIIANTFLLVINLSVGLLFASISILSKALDSVFDIVNAIVIHYTIRINDKKPDECHQFGHTRAENIAGYTTGILMIILSFAIIKISLEKIAYHQVIQYNSLMLITVLASLIIKLGLYFYMKSVIKHHNSPALKANAQDHINDVYVITGIFFAVIGLKYGYPIADPIIGLVIAAIIFKNGIFVSKDNLKYLMGESADENTLSKIKEKAFQVLGVKSINTIKTQYLGNKIQVEIHIDVDSKITLDNAHKISIEVRKEIEKMHLINDCFVHVDPIKD